MSFSVHGVVTLVLVAFVESGTVEITDKFCLERLEESDIPTTTCVLYAGGCLFFL